MRVYGYGLGITLALSVGVGLGGACSATGSRTSSGGLGGNGAGTTSSSSGPGGSLTGTGGGSGLGDGGLPDGLAACSMFSAQAQQAPAAMLIVLQRSASMSTSGKWSAAQQAIIQAIDEDVFDTMSLGLLSFPSSTYVNAPACLENATGGLITTVACGVDMMPAVAMAPAGMLKSNASSGVRHLINQWLQGNSPETADPSNATPMYDAMNKGYGLLQALPSSIQKRMLVLITDGGGSCTSLSNPTRPGYFDGACNDWEYPATFNTMISAAQTASTNAVDTFVVGVPGSNSTGQTQGAYATAPYSMLLALSTYAVSGSPTTVDPTCDKTAMFTQTGAAPAHPCHIDLSSNNFNAAALATAITNLRGKALGCVYPLPAPPAGKTIDPTLVNVIATLNGKAETIPKRSNPADPCTTGIGCWDYDTSQNVNLIGLACADVGSSATAEVDIDVGCVTITK